MSTEFGYLPPLPPITVTRRGPRPAARRPSARWESLIAATTVLLAGISVLTWTTQLDTTYSQIVVTTAAALTVILPKATFTLLRATSSRR
jgi:Mn2+/Fe2+ NRAMP family transporter